MEEESLRGHKHHTADKRTQIQQHGGDELQPDPASPPGITDPDNNKEKLGVNEEHKTEAMRKQHRGTFP
jgi:hypothetical protein